VASGHPWIFASDVLDTGAAEAGAAVKVVDGAGRALGTAHFSSASQIALRMLSPRVEEIDRGSTFVQSVEMLVSRGAVEVYGACTHAVLSGSAPDRLSKTPLKELVVTDTVPVPPEKRLGNLVVLSIAPLLGECIKRISSGQSVSALFE
jgi:ribose-phosphate pyrophosphokinase